MQSTNPEPDPNDASDDQLPFYINTCPPCKGSRKQRVGGEQIDKQIKLPREQDPLTYAL